MLVHQTTRDGRVLDHHGIPIGTANYLPQLELLIVAAGRNALTVGVDRHGPDRSGMCLHFCDATQMLVVPDAKCAVVATDYHAWEARKGPYALLSHPMADRGSQ